MTFRFRAVSEPFQGHFRVLCHAFETLQTAAVIKPLCQTLTFFEIFSKVK